MNQTDTEREEENIPETAKTIEKNAKKEKKIDWDFVEYCWQHEKRECQYVAAHYLKGMQKFLEITDFEKLKKFS